MFSSFAVDGNTNGKKYKTTHTSGNKNQWWEVDLLEVYPVYLVVVHIRWDTPPHVSVKINGAVIKVEKQVCGTIHYLPGMSVYPINCKGLKGRHVRIELPKQYLILSEVQVFGTGGPGPIGYNIGSSDYGMLLSQNKQSTQSSMSHGGLAMKAVDGNTDPQYGHKSVSHSGKPKDNWWRVNLYKDYHVNMVVIYNRRESPERINNAEVRSYSCFVFAILGDLVYVK